MTFVRWPDWLALGQLVREQTAQFVKAAQAGKKTSYSMAGRLQLSRSGWLVLSVPKALVRGAFDALQEPGLELPDQDAFIPVMTAEEVQRIGADNITERGHIFRYTLGKVQEVSQPSWKDIGKVWWIVVHSPQLEQLRRSYGLPSLLQEGKVPFHITIGLRRTHVIRKNPNHTKLK